MRLREGEPANVGQINAQLIQVGRAIDDGYPLEDVFDISDDTFQLYLALFDQRKRELKARLQSQFEVYGSDILYLCAIEIHSAHRGHGLGLAIVSRAIDTLGAGPGSLVVCKPYPLQHDSAHADDIKWRDRIGVAGFAAEQSAGTDKLRTYWSRPGFKRFGEPVTPRSPRISAVQALRKLFGGAADIMRAGHTESKMTLGYIVSHPPAACIPGIAARYIREANADRSRRCRSADSGHRYRPLPSAPRSSTREHSGFSCVPEGNRTVVNLEELPAISLALVA